MSEPVLELDVSITNCWSKLLKILFKHLVLHCQHNFFLSFLIPPTLKDNDAFQWYWRCLRDLHIFQWIFAKWCYDLFIANERCKIQSFWGERQFVEFFFKWSHLHRFVISSRVDVWASFLSWQIMLSQHYPLSVRYLFEMRNWTIYNTTGNTYRSINKIDKIN